MKFPKHEIWYGIEELQKPNDARANIPDWIPLGHTQRRPWRTKSLAEARAKFKACKAGTRKLRLVRLERHVIEEKEPTK